MKRFGPPLRLDVSKLCQICSLGIHLRVNSGGCGLCFLVDKEDREGNGTHSSTLAWKIPRTEEPGRLQSMGSLRVGHD